MNNAEDDYIVFKLLLLGDLSVGKTSILLKYVQNKFQEINISTIGVDFMDKIIDYGDKKVKLQIWDTSGQEKYKSIAVNFLRNADGAFLVYDITKQESFDHIKDWLKDVLAYNDEVKIIIIGNKLDLESQRKVKKNEIAEEFAKKNKYKLFETSAKDGTNIENAFKEMTDLLLKNLDSYRKNRGNSVLSKNTSNGEKKKKCC